MNSEYLELERLYFYINQQKSTYLKIWDGLNEKLKKHIDGTFDGSYQANLLQYLNEPVYSFGIFKKKKEIDEKKFVRDTHQLIYNEYWKDDKIVRKENKRSLNNKTKSLIETWTPHVMKSLIYKKMINSATIDTSEIFPL